MQSVNPDVHNHFYCKVYCREWVMERGIIMYAHQNYLVEKKEEQLFYGAQYFGG